MSILRTVAKSLIGAPVLTGVDLGTRSGEFWMMNQTGGYDFKFSYGGHSDAIKAYQQCAPLASVIDKKLQAYMNGKVYLVNKKGKARGKEATGEFADKVRRLMERPNPIQYGPDFQMQQYAYIQLFSWCLVFVLKPVGTSNDNATALWNIPPSMIDFEETKKSYLNAKSLGEVVYNIWIMFRDEKVPVSSDSFFLLKDISPSINSSFFPESKIKSLEPQIDNIIGAYESRNVLIRYRGALGIISPDGSSKDGAGFGMPLSEPEKEHLQSEFLKYGLKKQQWKFIISSAALKWSQVGVPTKDLMLFEEIQDDIMRICDRYNFPFPLFSSDKQNTLGGNQTDPNKTLLYTDAIIPDSDSICSQWNRFFGLIDIEFQRDYSHVAALQKDALKLAQARKMNNEARLIEFNNNLCTLDEWRISNGDEPIGGDFGGLYYYELKQKGFEFGTSQAPAQQVPTDQTQTQTQQQQ